MSKSQTKQKKSSAGKNIAIFFIVFVILEGLIIFGLTKLFNNEDSVVGLGGYSFYLMDSSNMEQDIPEDSLVIASDGSRDKKGSAVLCKNVGSEGTTVAWLYDISSKGDTVDGVVYTVYQESNKDKMYDLQAEDIIGIATSYYVVAGKIISIVTTPFGAGICVGLPLLLMIVLELIIAIAHHSGRREDDEDDDDEDDEDEYDYKNGENVTLDDFLYGGDDDNVYVTTKPKDTYEEEFEDKYSALLERKKPADKPEKAEDTSVPELSFVPVSAENNQPVAEKTEVHAVEPVTAEEPVVQTAVQPEEHKPEIDPSYYERASELIDSAVAEKTEQEHKAEVQQTVVKKSQPKKRPAASHKPKTAVHHHQHQDANAALEQLMKMMEEEQNKLKNNVKVPSDSENK
jgi:DNA-binding transcriptional regulator YdaS (Cro superfamily)